jgi:hypothetical protein
MPSAVRIALLAAIFAGIATGASAESVIKQCGDQWKAARAAGTTSGATWPQFLAQCRAQLSSPAAIPAPAPQTPAAPSATVLAGVIVVGVAIIFGITVGYILYYLIIAALSPIVWAARLIFGNAPRSVRLTPTSPPLPPYLLKQRGVGVAPSAKALDGLRDPFTGAPLNPRRGLYQCTNCQVYYHTESIAGLREQNQSRCIDCGLAAIVPVYLNPWVDNN